MPIRQRLVFLGTSLVILLLLARWTTGSFAFVMGEFWFSAGLLMLILLSIVDQPHFSKDANVFVNGLTGLVSLASVGPIGRDFFWKLFLFWSAYLVTCSYALMWWRSTPFRTENRLIVLLSRLNREIGRPEAIFSAFFLWAVLTQLGTNSTAFRPLFLFWAVFMILNVPGIVRALGNALARQPPIVAGAVGTLVKFRSPRLFECQLQTSSAVIPNGVPVAIYSRHGSHAADGVIIDDRILEGSRYCQVAISEFGDDWYRLAESGRAESAHVRLLAVPGEPTAMVVGVVEPGSSIQRLRLTVSPGLALQEGALTCVEMADRSIAYHQIVEAQVVEKAVAAEHPIQSILVTATQLGSWSEISASFEPVTWVPPPGQVVRSATGVAPPGSMPVGRFRVGSVPNSFFPVHVDLEESVTHNTAILGVTGSGKSYLAFSFIHELIQHGVKVLVLDISREHWAVLSQRMQPQQLAGPDAISDWLRDDDEHNRLGVHQFANTTSLVGRTAEFAEAILKEMKSRVRLRAGHNEPARVCLVLEEAHSLIPEWNQVTEKNDPVHVSRTARALLQGRKYGIGCIVISQRTANVTKTVLNQCNTIFALQCFDQTGFDFLKNYMGEDFTQLISTMPARHAIVVGRASSSRRPIMCRIDDFTERWSPEAAVRRDDEVAGSIDEVH